MNRRDFIALAGAAGAAAGFPRVVFGQQPAVPIGTKRVGIVWQYAEDDPSRRMRLADLMNGLASQGWHEQNLRLDQRYNGSTSDLAVPLAAEIIAPNPDVIVAQGSVPALEAMKLTRTTPIVFVTGTSDPVKIGLVDSISRPSGNVTGIQGSETSIVGKRVELLKEISPNIRSAGYIYDPESQPPGVVADIIMYFTAACAANGFERVLLPVHGNADVVAAIADFGVTPNRGIVVSQDATMLNSGETLLAGVARFRLPAVYPVTAWEERGGVVVYSADFDAIFQTGGEYVGRILNGTKVADLPVQFPTKYILTVNLKAAKALGLTVPASTLARADKVIE
jgi:putative ABC transport system substrate-binding protein